MIYLPSSSSIKCLDRFDILDSEEPEVQFWDILKAILREPASDIDRLIEQLETISVTRHGTANTDYGFLRDFITNHLPSSRYFFDSVWPGVAQLALELPALFPKSALPCLDEDNPQIVLSRRQAACLVAHQFLCSLPRLPWETDSFSDFHIWYLSDVRHPQATRAYLHALFAYFERFVDMRCSPLTTPVEEWPVVFTLRTFEESLSKITQISLAAECNVAPLCVNFLNVASTSPSLLGLPNGACVISANKNIGFGQTGTQEELHVGSSPEACPAVLLTPPLQDSQVLVVQGPEAMISIKGHGRDACLDMILEPEDDNRPIKWIRRTMLFMDALELDLYDTTKADILRDLLPGNIDREVTKAYNAFSSKGSCLGSTDETYAEICTGLWGCGAFGGNREVKAIIQWCAASMAKVPLNFICAGDGQAGFATSLNSFVENGLRKGWKVKDVLDALRAWRPEDGSSSSAFAYVVKTLDK